MEPPFFTNNLTLTDGKIRDTHLHEINFKVLTPGEKDILRQPPSIPCLTTGVYVVLSTFCRWEVVSAISFVTIRKYRQSVWGRRSVP